MPDAPDPVSSPVSVRISVRRVVTRFAPSPTGALHVGGARTALFNWAYARRHGGRFLLRVEDTDQARSSDASARGILRDLQWVGVLRDLDPSWYGGPDPDAATPYDVASQIGAEGPYFQSQRLALYDRYAQLLLSHGLAYDDAGAVRFRVPPVEIAITDQVLGEVRVPAGQTEDFVIRKRDGFPTYHFAVVVDDALMGVTHVIRGQEHLSNTPRHVALQDALRALDHEDAPRFERPAYAHIPLIFNPDGSKMSKRDKSKAAREAARERGLRSVGFDDPRFAQFLDKQNDDMDLALAAAGLLGLALPEIEVKDFRDSGYLATALCNYLSLLGWNPGNDLEKFDNAYLAASFGFDRVGKTNSRFDRDKLKAFNQDAIKSMPADELRRAVWRAGGDRMRGGGFSGPEDPRWGLFCEAYRERSRTLLDPVAQGAFMLTDEPVKHDFNEKSVRKAMLGGEPPTGAALLRAFHEGVLADEAKTPGGAGFGRRVQDAIKPFLDGLGVGNIGRLAQPIRVALSGGTVTPPLDLTLELMGRERTLRRVAQCLRAIEAVAPA